jgi:hypothetical protein
MAVLHKALGSIPSTIKKEIINERAFLFLAYQIFEIWHDFCIYSTSWFELASFQVLLGHLVRDYNSEQPSCLLKNVFHIGWSAGC